MNSMQWWQNLSVRKKAESLQGAELLEAFRHLQQAPLVSPYVPGIWARPVEELSPVDLRKIVALQGRDATEAAADWEKSYGHIDRCFYFAHVVFQGAPSRGTMGSPLRPVHESMLDSILDETPEEATEDQESVSDDDFNSERLSDLLRETQVAVDLTAPDDFLIEGFKGWLETKRRRMAEAGIELRPQFARQSKPVRRISSAVMSGWASGRVLDYLDILIGIRATNSRKLTNQALAELIFGDGSEGETAGDDRDILDRLKATTAKARDSKGEKVLYCLKVQGVAEALAQTSPTEN